MIKTSYFANRKIGNLIPVRISEGKPRWWKGQLCECRMLMPTSFERYCEDADKAKEALFKRLDAVGIRSIMASLPVGDCVLLCFEKPGEGCHRHWVAEWLTQNGVPCEEVSSETPAAQTRPESSGTLF